MKIGRFILAALTLTLASGAFALPKYAQKEKKECKFCHTNPRGGGARTAAGEWYKKKHTLVGYKEAPANPKKK